MKTDKEQPMAVCLEEIEKEIIDKQEMKYCGNMELKLSFVFGGLVGMIVTSNKSVKFN